MSPIIGLQRQMRELGRIRTGNQVATASGGRKHPAKLDTFRITSEAKELVEAAAAEFGGVVTPWKNGDHDEWEVVTTATAMEIIVPPGQVVSQWNELWSGGGCLRRCDGVTEWMTDTGCGEQSTILPPLRGQTEQREIPPCPLDPGDRNEAAKNGLACKMTTRLNVILPQLPDLGVWRLESHGYYAAVELAGAADVLAMARSTGYLIPARLRLEQRSKKTPGQPTKMFAVPIIEFVETRMRDLQLTARAGESGDQRQLGTGRPAIPALPPGTPPPTSDFRAPLPASETSADGATPQEAPGASPTPAPQSVPTQPGSVAGGQAAGEQNDPDERPRMTRDELLARLVEARISFDYAVEKSRTLWPDRGPGVQLNEYQLHDLWIDLSKEAAAAAL